MVDSEAGLVGGVDGVSGKSPPGKEESSNWVMVVTGAAHGSLVKEFSVWTSFADLWKNACEKGLLAVAVDIPIGLPGKGGRTADREARYLLKGPPNRASSVFPAPPLCTLGATTYRDAQDLSRNLTGKGMTRQTFALLPKIRDVRGSLELGAFDAGARTRAAEVHPEVSFANMAGCPMSFHKSRQAGVAERLALLKGHFPNIVEAAVATEITGPPTPGLDDVLDAVAAAWTARRLVSGDARALGCCDLDETCYPMKIWV